MFTGLLGWQIYEKVNASQTNMAKKQKNKPVIAVETESVRISEISDLHFYNGSLKALSAFQVSAKVSGILENIGVNVGDQIKKGQIIASIEDTEYYQQTESTKAEIMVARANLNESISSLTLAEKDLERGKQLYEKKIIADSEYDLLLSKFNSAVARKNVMEAQVNQREKSLELQALKLSYTKIPARWQGGSETRFVSERYVEPGALINANQPLLTLIDISSLIAEIYVTEKEYAAIKTGQEVKLKTEAFGKREFRGKVIRISPQLNENTRQAKVEILVPNHQYLLKPGMFSRVSIEYQKHLNSRLVPLSSLIKQDDNSEAVFILEPKTNTARLVKVDTGIKNQEYAEIISPNIQGQVITLGQHLLEDGASVKTGKSEKKPIQE